MRRGCESRISELKRRALVKRPVYNVLTPRFPSLRLNAYIITFASFQLSSGRLADLSSAGWVFITGITVVSVINLVLSFRESRGDISRRRGKSWLIRR
jgi:hypothetical protein